MSAPVVPATTRENQRTASDPQISAWVSANAGSGKTYVLSRRIVRLLLDDVDPSRILALTFTKAAAATMATRVFGLLGGWVGLDDAALDAEIEAIEGERPSPAKRARARRLFARAVETPGGLKIQTIHAFCERLLQICPFEAGVPARFTVLDDLTGAELQARAQAAVLAAAQTDAVLGDALEVVNALAAEDTLKSLLAEAVAARQRFRLADRDHVAALPGLIAEALGVDPGDTVEAIDVATVAEGLSPAERTEVILALDAGKTKRDQTIAKALRTVSAGGPPDGLAEAYRSIFLTSENEKRADNGFLVKAFRDRHPGLAARMVAERERVFALLDRRRAVATAQRSVALLRLAAKVVHRYEAEKTLRAALDFDDLIARTRDLLTAQSAAWIHYKLDQGIDHLLVDEAQDTSDPQWAILAALTSEFTAGLGTNPRVRTLFAVGDPKQSIFSFQGASPAAFERFRSELERKMKPLQERDPRRWRFENTRLTLSFRSAPVVLKAVDAVFDRPEARQGLSADDVGPTHQSARPDAGGTVELWPPVTAVKTPDPSAWARPLDVPDVGAPSQRLAQRIARVIRRWITLGDETGRIVQPGEVLILVRNRNAFFEAVIRELKAAQVPVAGADRLQLTNHIAVQDLVALGRACLLPDDDLTLATVLKSPLLGLDEDALFRLAADRPGSLVAALATSTDLAAAAAWARFTQWRRQARQRGPFGFYAAVLGPDGGRKALLDRLGPEAGDAVDEFLRLALDHETRETPTLGGFLGVLESAELTIKRDLDMAVPAVRVMTVHGAKGLEASTVILADTCTAPNGTHDPDLIGLAVPVGARMVEVPVWAPSSKDDCSPVAQARAAVRAAAGDEYRRLLYVALTRAADRLIIAGYHGDKGRPDGCWYDLVEAAVAPLSDEVPAPDGEGTVLRFTRAGSGPQASVPPPGLAAIAEPEWLRQPVAEDTRPARPLRPSRAGDPAGAPLDRRAAAVAGHRGRRRGRLAHALLELLPEVLPESRGAAGRRLLAIRAPDWDDAARSALVDLVVGLLATPALSDIFGPCSRAEVPVSGRVRVGPQGIETPVVGQIDRIAVHPDRIVVADYKSGAVPSDARFPDAYVTQLALYRALLTSLYPGRAVEAILVWTDAPSFVVLAPDQLDAALAAIRPA